MGEAAAEGGARVHPSSVVEAGAILGSGVRIGPFCHVGPEVVLGEGVELVSHVTIAGATTVGEGTRVHPQAALGGPPQNVKHRGGRTTLTIGRDCVIREGVTAHCGTDDSRGATLIGDGCLLMAYSHVAHDCVIGNRVIFANGVALGGHCEIADGVIIGGLSAVHQFARIGRNAFIGGMTGVTGDVIPYGMVIGNRARLRGLNLVGLKRAGVKREELLTLRRAYRALFDPARPLAENAELVRAQFGASPRVAEILDFVTVRGSRIFCVPPRRGEEEGDGAED